MSDRYRELLGTAFDRAGDQWIWFANAWSRGVPVSPEERELYLAFNPLGFRRAIKGRFATHPRRPYGATLKRLLTAIFTGRDPSA